MNSLLVAAVLVVGTDPGSEVLAIVSAKCASCHGEKLAKPKGGIVLSDLAKVAANREIVVPGDLKHSNLWLLVFSGNMPPNDSPTGPLTQLQKDLIKAWIEAGCPVPMTTPVPPVESVPATAVPGQDGPGEPLVAEPQGLGKSVLARSVDWLGNFHLLVLHFPIALVMAAAGAEALAWWLSRVASPERQILASLTQVAVTALVALATAAAVPTVALGWLHAVGGAGAGQPDNLFWHRWVGTGALLLLGAATWLSWGDAAGKTRRLVTRAALLGSALAVGVAGHFGGMMVHGRAFLNW